MALSQAERQHRTDVAPHARTFNAVDWIAMILLIVGGLNWGLVGLFQFDLVAAIFGGVDSVLARIVYVLVGLSALWCIYTAMKVNSRNDTTVAR